MTCMVCKGYGFVEYYCEHTSDPRFGKAIPCPQCQGGEAGFRARQLERVSRVPERFRSAHTEDFPQHTLREYMEEALHRRLFITVWGAAGVGKTHMLTSVINDSVAEGQTAVYVKWSELLDHLRSAFNNNVSAEVDEYWKTLKDSDVLAIDEVDKARTTDYAYEKLFELVDHRYGKMTGLTLFATNKRFQAGDALAGDSPGPLESRLRERGNVIIPMGNVDRRPSQQVEWFHE